MKTYFRILSYTRKYFIQIVFHVLFAVLGVVAIGLALSLLDPVLNLLFSAGEPPEALKSHTFSLNISKLLHNFILDIIRDHGKETALLFAILIIVGINIAGNISRYLGNFFMSIIRTKVVEDIRSGLFQNLNRLQVRYFEGERKGDIMTRMTSDVNEIEKSVITTFHSLIRDPFTILFFVFLMMRYSWQLTLFIFAVLPVTAIIVTVIAKSLRKDAYSTQDMLSRIMSIVDEFTSGIRIIRAFNASNYISGLFIRYNNQYSHYLRRQYIKQTMIPPLSETMGVLTVGMILWFGGRLVFDGVLTASGFLVFIFYFQQIMKPAKNISSAFTQINRGIASGNRLFRLMDAGINVREKTGSKTINWFQQEIEFRNVSFAYNHEKVLKNIHLRIPKGKILALVGPSGSGKTTFAELILRFYDPTDGEILLDGVNLKEYSLKDLRNLTGLVTQEPILFNDTIYNNIAFGLSDPREEEVIRAAKAANAHEFILNCEEGYQTEIGDRGILLSGGQRQRLSIARAVLKNPPVLILDEATSSLDTSSEKMVQEALYELMKHRTSIVIAHRLSTIREADEIVVLDKGEIVEQGAHPSLVKQHGLYNKLYNLQQLGS